MASIRRLAALSGQLQTSLSVQPVGKCCAQRKAPMKVLVTGAAGNIGYAILFMIAQGDMLGLDQPVHIVLLDIPPMAKVLKGVVMELQDCAFPLVAGITATTKYEEAFKDIDVACLVGSRPRGKGMSRRDLLTANAKIFSGQGKALDMYAKKTVKVLVVGNPANTNCLTAMTNAPSLPRTAFAAMTRLDQNRATAMLANRLGVANTRVKNVLIWGNHSPTMYADVNNAVVANFPRCGFHTSVRAVVNNNEWLNGQFLKDVQDRGTIVIQARGKSSAASAASSACDCIRSWIRGTAAGEMVSMGVCSDGSYGVPEGLIFSFPVVCKNGQYQIVQGLKFDEFGQQKMKITTQELLEEKAAALAL